MSEKLTFSNLMKAGFCFNRIRHLASWVLQAMTWCFKKTQFGTFLQFTVWTVAFSCGTMCVVSQAVLGHDCQDIGLKCRNCHICVCSRAMCWTKTRKHACVKTHVAVKEDQNSCHLWPLCTALQLWPNRIFPRSVRCLSWKDVFSQVQQPATQDTVASIFASEMGVLTCVHVVMDKRSMQTRKHVHVSAFKMYTAQRLSTGLSVSLQKQILFLNCCFKKYFSENPKMQRWQQKLLYSWANLAVYSR